MDCVFEPYTLWTKKIQPLVSPTQMVRSPPFFQKSAPSSESFVTWKILPWGASCLWTKTYLGRSGGCPQ